MEAAVSPAYAAGFFDGEGSAVLTKPSKASSGKRPYLRVSLYQNDREVLDRIQSQWGGRVYLKPDHRNHYLRLCTRAARKFLVDILPFLIVKKAAVEELLDRESSFGRGL